MKNILMFLLMLCPAVLPFGLYAQDEEEAEDYTEMAKQAMKSDSYNQSDNWDARVKRISGDVRVRASGGEKWFPLEGEMPLSFEDSIKTTDGVAEIYLDDKGSIVVGRNTEMEVSSIEKGDSRFNIKFGSLAAKIQHFMSEKFKMQVRTPSAVCAVRGTEFAVEYSQLAKETGVAVFDEGKLAVSPMDEKGQPQPEYLLDKNTELVFAHNQKRFRTAPLSRMVRHRASVIAMRKRMPALKRSWKPVGPQKRAVLREKIFNRNAVRSQKAVQQRIEKKGKRPLRAKKAAGPRAKSRVKAEASPGGE